MLLSEIVESYDISIFNFLRNLYTIFFLLDCSNLHSYQQWVEAIASQAAKMNLIQASHVVS